MLEFVRGEDSRRLPVWIGHLSSAICVRAAASAKVDSINGDI